MSRPQHPARAARAVTAGLSTAAAFGIVAALAADDAVETLPGDTAVPGTAVVEIRIAPGTDQAAAAAAVRDWLDGVVDADGEPGVALVERDRPPDTVSGGS